jgi:4-hydroxybenzoate polyprenyltransferase
MNLGWVSEKGASLMAFVAALALLATAFFYPQYRYVFICVAVVAFIYGYRQLRKQDTPFEKHERELRRRTL